MMNELQSRAFNNSLTLSIVYVGIGTVSVLSMYTDSFVMAWFALIGIILTFPVSFVSLGIIYMEPNNYVEILLVQSVVFGLFWFISYRVLLKRYSKS